MGKGKNVPVAVRKMIIDHHKKGLGYKNIAKTLFINVNIVARIVQNYKKFGIIGIKKGQGRQKVTSAKMDRSCWKNF